VIKATRWIRSAGVATALVAGGGFALAGPATPALAFFSGGLFLDVVPQSPATLVAGGAAVDTPVEVTCNATGTVFLHVNVTEKVGKKVASGDSFSTVSCSGAHQRFLVRVTASSDTAFAKGSGVVTADVTGCNTTLCGSETGSATVKIKK
jgi:hypothetical protein